MALAYEPLAEMLQPRLPALPERKPNDILLKRDEALKKRLEQLSAEDDDFWSFKDNDEREHAHAYFQYPAMMVPQMQGELIRAVCAADTGVRRVFDPFVGSGTILAEAMMRGLSFVGQDVNPLAVLLCRAKTEPFDEATATALITDLLGQIRADTRAEVPVEFRNRDKWFQPEVQVALARIRRGIQGVESLPFRRFLWVALAETIRLTSNSRTSTYKLHIRDKEEMKTRKPDAVTTFEAILRRNVANMGKQQAVLAQNGWLAETCYSEEVRIKLGDSAVTPAQHMRSTSDLLVTSPPYGDNQSTVPYGQHSYLPLQWIPRDDVDPSFDETYLESTHAIDSKSLGGRRKDALVATSRLLDLSPSFRATIESLKDMPLDRRSRVAAFCRDLDRCIDPILSQLRPDAYMIWTTGNRKVGGQRIPLDGILSELLVTRGAGPVATIDRKILSKRMPSKNSIAATMSVETILVFRNKAVPNSC